VEEALGRYLGVFLPFVATLCCAHLILRASGASLVLRAELGSPRLLRRALAATSVAALLIVGVDTLTGGELFLHPRFPSSQLLMTLLVVVLALAATLSRTLAPFARRLRRA
jgi:hypothetical protein